MYNSLTTLIFGDKKSDTSYLFNDYAVDFDLGGKHFHCVEQYMLYRQAELYADEKAMREIMSTAKPEQLNGIAVSYHEDSAYKWYVLRPQILLEGVMAKFSQNLSYDTMLCHTPHHLIYASTDTFHGVGLAYDNSELSNPQNWFGQNMLGYTLMYVRSKLLEKKIAMAKQLGYTAAFTNINDEQEGD